MAASPSSRASTASSDQLRPAPACTERASGGEAAALNVTCAPLVAGAGLGTLGLTPSALMKPSDECPP